MNPLDIGRILVGLILLVGGGELLVRGASTLAVRVGISPLVVGLTVVAAATSAPELAVTVDAVLDGETDLAIGNVVGSNIANILLILGASALVLPLVVRRQLLKIDVPVLVLLSVLLLVLSLDGGISRVDGLVLLTVLVGYTLWTVRVSKRASTTEADTDVPATSVSVPVSVLMVIGGVALLVAGSQLLVDGAVNIATSLGVSGLVVGLTVVAIGTSLPELAASVVAVRKRQTELAVGNAVGSCLANIGLVLGVPALFTPGGLAVPGAAVALDIPLMIAAALVLLPVAFTRALIVRWEGIVFVGLYAAYTGYVVLAATDHDAAEGFSTVMLIFVLPLVAGVPLLSAVYEAGVRRGRGQSRIPAKD